MNITTLVNEIREQGYNVEAHNVQKGGAVLPAVVFREEGEALGYTLYPMQGETAADIIARYEEAKKEGAPAVNMDLITDWEKAKKHLMLCVRPITHNKDQVVQECAERDIEIYIRLIIAENDEKKASVIINWGMLNTWGITDRELFAAVPRPEYIIGGMFNILDGGPLCRPEEVNLDDMPMYVISNPDKYHGAAAAFFRPDVLQAIAEKNGDIYILPSSIHECIICSVRAGEPEALAAMVKEINAGVVAVDERLSDHVYKYSKLTGRLETVA